MNQLQTYDWPGNVRELQNVIERAIITSQSGKLHFDLPAGKAPRETPDSTFQEHATRREGAYL